MKTSGHGGAKPLARVGFFTSGVLINSCCPANLDRVATSAITGQRSKRTYGNTYTRKGAKPGMNYRRPKQPYRANTVISTAIANCVAEALEGRRLLSTSPAVLYNLGQVSFGSTAANGAGQTIAILEAGDDPTLAADVATFDTRENLSAVSLTVGN